MACVALKIPRAIRLIRLFNMLFSLLRVETRCVERPKRRYCALFSFRKQKGPPTITRGGPFYYFRVMAVSHRRWPNRSRALIDVSIS
jgi:hypothetical protein